MYDGVSVFATARRRGSRGPQPGACGSCVAVEVVSEIHRYGYTNPPETRGRSAGYRSGNPRVF